MGSVGAQLTQGPPFWAGARFEEPKRERESQAITMMKQLQIVGRGPRDQGMPAWVFPRSFGECAP